MTIEAKLVEGHEQFLQSLKFNVSALSRLFQGEDISDEIMHRDDNAMAPARPRVSGVITYLGTRGVFEGEFNLMYNLLFATINPLDKLKNAVSKIPRELNSLIDLLIDNHQDLIAELMNEGIDIIQFLRDLSEWASTEP